MKILKLRFRNIHSLKGDQEIDFTISPFTESGLFAITGPTGAGKSTILDVITLALFSKIPRFDGKITHTEIEKIGSVMTHFTDDAYAEIDYQCKDKFYRSTWSISKTSKGKLKEYQMSLAVFDDISMAKGTYIGEKKSTVPLDNEEIIGLNYEQFIRSILLSQGEFAKFLKSDEKERAKLLEDITGSQIYRTIGKAVFEKAKTKRDEIINIKREIESIPTLNEGQIAEKKQLITNNKIAINAHETTIQKSTLILNTLEKKEQLQDKLEKLIVEKKSITDHSEQFKPKEEKWKRHQKLDFHRNDITLLNDEQTRLENLLKAKTNLVQNIDNQKTIIQKILQDITLLVKQEVVKENYALLLKKFEQNILNLDHTLKALTEDGTKLRGRINNLYNSNQNAYISNIQKLKNIDEQVNYAKTSLAKYELKSFSKNDEGTLKSNISATRIQLDTLKEKCNDASKKEDAIKEIEQFNYKIEESILSKTSLNTDLNGLYSLLKVLTDDVKELTKKKEDQFKINSFEDHRNELVDGDPCPLCGALDHPFVHKKLLITIGAIELELHQKTASFNTKTNEQTKTISQIAAIDERVKILSKQIEDKNLIVVSVIKKWQISKDEVFSSQEINKNIRIVNEKLDAFIKEENDRSNKNFLQACVGVLEEISEITNQYKKTKIDKDLLYAGKNISEDVNDLEKRYSIENDKLMTHQATVTSYSENESELNNTIQARSYVLLPALATLGYANVIEAKKDILDDTNIQEIQKQKDFLTKSIIENETSIQNISHELEGIKITENAETNLDKIKEKISFLNAEKDQFLTTNGATENELKRDQENKISIEQIVASVKAKEEEAKKWFVMDQLIGDATGNKFSKYAQNLSLKHLLVLANKRLVRLTDRYLLSPSEIESDLTVLDIYQGNVKRSVKTLSGGESFIVSLALALSLSDMASKNVKLESLFIDEGFGSLDAGTLEIALETLERLQSESNRMIGIISHVDSLKERITTQIKVKKSNQGYSVLEVV